MKCPANHALVEVPGSLNDASKNGFKPGEERWRCFELRDMSQLTVQAGAWQRGWTKGKRPQSCIDRVVASVDAAHAAEILNISR